MALGGRRTAKQPLPLHERALVLLAVRQRSRRELRSRLLGAGFPEHEVDEELAALESVGLIDDGAFARAAAERGGGGGWGGESGGFGPRPPRSDHKRNE
ncbi:MAG: hypothetical protein ACKO8G_06105, partial [Actinomycetota bacterium]